MVCTIIFQGPVKRTKRIIKINRELPTGETELLATLEQPGSEGSEAVLVSPSGENNKGLQELLNGTTGPHNMMSEQTAKSLYKLAIQPMQPSRKQPEPQIESKIIPQRESLKKGSIAFSLPETDLTSIKKDRKTSILSEEEESIQPYRPALHQQLSIQEEEQSSCGCWPRKKGSFKRGSADKGKGMTQSELPSDDKTLPGLQALLANYAKMLYEEKVNFVKTLFRAVKLNKLDVTRILCKIIQKSGYRLSSTKLREPQSSATVLHVAVLYNRINIVKFLVKQQETSLLMAKYETEEYRNQTVLHVAVAGGNQEILQIVLDGLDNSYKKQLLNTVADGNYFKRNHPLGALCLSAAAWSGNGEHVKVLVKHGADLSLKNHLGNTLLHCLILQSAQYPSRCNYRDLLDNIWEATGLWAEREDPSDDPRTPQQTLQLKQSQIDLFRRLLAIRNNEGYTPLELGAAINSALYGHLIDTEKIFKIPQNTLGSLTFVTYDVSDISSYAFNTYNKFSILHILAHNSTFLTRQGGVFNDQVDLLDTEPIRALQQCKWAVYRVIYILWFVLHLSYMVLFTSVTIQTNSAPMTCVNSTSCMTRIRCRLSCTDVEGEIEPAFAVFSILPLVYIILESIDLFGNRPYRFQYLSNKNIIVRLCKCVVSEWTIVGNGPYRFVGIAFCICELDWFRRYLISDPNQEISLAMALLLGWMFVLFFTRACRITCKFSIMIQKMFFRDLIYFLTVYGIVLLAFSFSVNSMFSYIRDTAEFTEFTLNQVFYDMMNVVTDLDRKQTPHAARHDTFTKLLLVFYAIMAVILLMNMLIAMMNTSYETVRMTRCNLWKQQQLSVMLMIERRFSWCSWLCRRSEKDVWRRKEDLTSTEDLDDVRTYLDVTVLHKSAQY